MGNSFGVRLVLSLPKGGSAAAFANDPHHPIAREAGTATEAARQSLSSTTWSCYNDHSLIVGVTMKQIRASLFKARCLKIMSEIQSTGEPVVVTKRGAPVVKVVPASAGPAELFGFMSGEFSIVGDIESPVVPLKDWKVLKK